MHSSLLSTPGVIAVGEFSPRGDAFRHAGMLGPQQAHLASIMCRANTQAIQMQVAILNELGGSGGLSPVRGWIVQGAHFSVCVVGHRFCFLEQGTAPLSQVLARMAGDSQPFLVESPEGTEDVES